MRVMKATKIHGNGIMITCDGELFYLMSSSGEQAWGQDSSAQKQAGTH
jgi:hypothetical protein